MELFDISRSVSPSTAVWPGDRSVEWNWTACLEDEDSVNVGALCMSAHTGTHVDAPFHVAEEGRTTEELPLSAFVGPVEVVDARTARSITSESVPSAPTAPRLLFRTPASEVPDTEWPDEVTHLTPDAVQALEERGVVLVGTDAPSVDPLESATLEAHHALRSASVVHLEGLNLAGVEPGAYTLLALPLRLPDADAAPVRALLAKDSAPEDFG